MEAALPFEGYYKLNDILKSDISQREQLQIHFIDQTAQKFSKFNVDDSTGKWYLEPTNPYLTMMREITQSTEPNTIKNLFIQDVVLHYDGTTITRLSDQDWFKLKQSQLAK